MYKLVVSALIVLIIFGCNNDEIVSKNVPENLEFDLNQDGIVDYQIIYSKISALAPIDPDPGPLDHIIARLEAKNNNQILRNTEVSSILFLNDTELVQEETTLPHFWKSTEDENSNIVVSISQNFDGESWPEKWNIRCEEIQDSYLIGFKLMINNSPNIGFIEISIDDQTGQIQFLNVEFLE